jgi:hypothetical protein
MIMLAAARRDDLTREAEQDKMAARARAAARFPERRAGRPAARTARRLALAATGTRPTTPGR